MKLRNSKYPRRLLPKHGNKKIRNADRNLSCYSLIRLAVGDNVVRSLADAAHEFTPSQFLSGLSVNLLGEYKKRDVRYVVDYSNKSVSADWLPGMQTIRPRVLKINRCKSYCGVEIANLKYARIKNCSIKQKGVEIRKDDVFLKCEHYPTVSNFWHFNIFVYGINSKTNEIYRIDEKCKDISKSQIPKIAQSLLMTIEKSLQLPKDMTERRIPRCLYR